MKPYTCSACMAPCRGKWINEGLGWGECWGQKFYDHVPAFVSECCDEPTVEDLDEIEDEDPRY